MKRDKELIKALLFYAEAWNGSGAPVSDVWSHTQTMNACHFCGIAARLGREVKWNPKTKNTGDSESNSFFAREQRKGCDIPNVS
jgi:hypothetical protein